MLLLAGMAAWAVAFCLCYPRTFAIVDEDAYLTQAYLFRQGRLTYEQSSIPAPHMTVETGGRLASKYPPGTSLLLLPFTFAGWRATFAAGLLLALAGTWLFALVLRRLAPGTDPAWALLWLCYPAVTLYSRTLMSDLPAAVLTLAAFLALVRERRFAAGLALGAAVLVRYSNGLLGVAFALVLLATGPRRLRGVLGLGLGMLPGVLLALGYNWWCYGGPFSFPMYLTGVFSPVFFPRNAVYYGRSLLLVYPLMLLAPLLVGRRWRLAVSVPAYAVLALYCFFSYVHDVPGVIEQATVGLRYLLPGLGFFVLALALVLARLESGLRGFGVVKYLLLGLALVAAVAVHWRHDRHLAEQDRYRRLVYATVPEGALVAANARVTELFSHAWGDRRYLRFAEFNVRVPVDAALAAADDPWALLMQPAGRRNYIELALFFSLLARFPERELVLEEETPRRLEAWRLRPGRGD